MNARETRYLRQLSTYRDRPPTVAGVFRASLKTYAFLAAAFGVLALVAWGAFGTPGLVGVAASYATMLLRDLGHVRRSLAVWPITRDVIDWPKVEALVAASEPARKGPS